MSASNNSVSSELGRGESLAVDAVTFLRASLRSGHVATANGLRNAPFERGPRSSSSSVSPVVIDANVLRGEVLRLVTHPLPTVLVSNATSGYITLFCARHVLDEVEEHLESWALEADLDPLAAGARWREDIAPVLRVVEVPEGLLTKAENDRLLELCTDADDRPTATLAMLLGAPLLSRDKRPLRAVYGAQVDHLTHAQACSVMLREVGDLGLLGELTRVGAAVANLMGVAVVSGLSALRRRVSLPVLVGVGGAAVAVGLGVLPLERRQRALRAALRVGSALVGGAAATHEIEVEAREALATLIPPRCTPDQVRDELDECRLIARAALFALAWAPTSPLEVEELSDAAVELLQLPGDLPIMTVLESCGSAVRFHGGSVAVGNFVAV